MNYDRLAALGLLAVMGFGAYLVVRYARMVGETVDAWARVNGL